MATTTWPATLANEVISGRGAKTIAQAFFDRDMVVQQSGTTISVAGNTASTSYATIDTFTIRFPRFAISGRVMRLFVHLTDTGAGASNFRIQDNATATNGTDSTGVTTDDWVESILTIGASWENTDRVINVQARATGGSTDAAVDTVNCAMNLRWGDT